MDTLASQDWRCIAQDYRTGPMQMALDEVAAETAVEDGLRTVRVYSWEPSTLSLGYRQDPETVDWAYCEQAGIDVTRRQTGGGGIYHDVSGDISYSIVAPAEELPGDLMDCYELLCEPIFDAFERMDVDARFADTESAALYQPSCYLREINPAHDVVADGTADSHKISGNAQYRQRDAVIQHGSLSYALVPDHHLGVFSDPGVSSDTFRDRVTSIREQSGIDRESAVTALETALSDWADADEAVWTDAELDRARELVDAKYGQDAWIRDRETPAV
jgi:lipoate-protein ligase A